MESLSWLPAVRHHRKRTVVRHPEQSREPLIALYTGSYMETLWVWLSVKKKVKGGGVYLWLSVLCAEITCIFMPWSWEQLLKYASHWCCIRWPQASFSSFYTPIPITLQNLTDTLLMGTRWSWLNTIWIEQDHIHLAINFSYGPSEGNLKISMCLGGRNSNSS